MTIADLKNRIDFASLVAETHIIGRDSKTLCPQHDDRRPSCHIYADHAYCFACGWHADALDWLRVVQGLDTVQAVHELRLRIKGFSFAHQKNKTLPKRNNLLCCSAAPLPQSEAENYLRRAAALDRIPLALGGRGFTLEDCRRLQIARSGEHAELAITSPEGCLIAIKRRLGSGQVGRYRYLTPGQGAPAWCSPGFTDATTLLVMEGELNAMSAWLARDDLGVMGVAGSSGCLHLGEVRGKKVYVYADGDTPGQLAKEKWAEAVSRAGAADVFTLFP